MSGSKRISDSDLRERLEEHGYNVPPITDTTKAILIKKLAQLDAAAAKSKVVESRRRYSNLDYSSAEDEDAPTPLASSTRAGRSYHHEEASAVTSRVSRSNGAGRVHHHHQHHTRKQASLIHHSEEEESENEEEEDEEEVDEEEEEEESEEEEDNIDRVDFAVQTSMLESPSPPRFRGQKLSNNSGSFSQSGAASPNHNNNYNNSTPTYPILSPFLRKNIKKHGSLNEALSTLPNKSKSSALGPGSPNNSPPSSPASTSITSQASPKTTNHNNSSYNTSYSRDQEGVCSSRIVSTLIMTIGAVFFLGLALQYMSLVPQPQHSVIAVCGGLEGEIPGTTCVPSTQLNDTVQLYKAMTQLLPGRDACHESTQLAEEEVAVMVLENNNTERLWRFYANLLVLLKQNPNWGIRVEERNGQLYFNSLASKSWLCAIYRSLSNVVKFVVDGVWMIMSVLLMLVVVFIVFKVLSWRKARQQRHREEVFMLARQATNLVYQHHQMNLREGKHGANTFMAIKHVRDQLIPLEERASKAGLWKEVEQFIENNESRVRQDVQKIYSEEFRVWQWLPELAWSPHDGPYSVPSSPVSGPSPPMSPTMSPVSSGPNTPSNPWPHVPTTHAMGPGWQGCAFPGSKNVSSPAVAPPTSCLKVRQMFDRKHQANIAGNNWTTVVKNEIVKRCTEAKILHIAVDTASDEGTVYIKTESLEDAGKVFRCLHGQWYRGQLVTAKYLKLERYHERFPDSVACFTPLKPNRK